MGVQGFIILLMISWIKLKLNIAHSRNSVNHFSYDVSILSSVTVRKPRTLLSARN